MSGIYIHIPFCKQSCHYCDFHFSTTFKGYRDRMIAALCKEIELQKHFLNTPLETLYFGGGTPSLLTAVEVEQIIEKVRNTFDATALKEITLEANPDDLSETHLHNLFNAGINRLSIGIQSFFDEDLQYMNRAHNSKQALRCVALAQQAGIENISIDLIYGFPGLTVDKWQRNLDTAIEMGVSHISSYAMTVETGTALSQYILKGKSPALDDEQSIQHFKMLQRALNAAGFVHYEISNFALPEKISQHNSSYWQGKKYLGIGPSAHSFDGTKRYWNVSNNMRYILEIEQNNVPAESEEITNGTAYNEYVLTRLRTIWGVEDFALKAFGEECATTFHKEVQVYLKSGMVQYCDGKFTLSDDGKFIADRIASDLFVLTEK